MKRVVFVAVVVKFLAGRYFRLLYLGGSLLTGVFIYLLRGQNSFVASCFSARQLLQRLLRSLLLMPTIAVPEAILPPLPMTTYLLHRCSRCK
jgi:hypothetical protein